VSFWQPFLKPHQTYLIWLLLEGKDVPAQYEKTRDELREWFKAEVNANAEARRKQTCV
jgi:hypothetical protein